MTPRAIEPAVRRFCQLVAETAPGLRVAGGMLDVRGEVPEPFVVMVSLERVHRQTGVLLGAGDVARLLEPIGFTVLEEAGGTLSVEVPTNRPDVRTEPYGVDDVVEEIVRTFGYSNVPRRIPTWPQPGGLTPLQRSRRVLKGVMGGLGASEGWTDTFVSAEAHDAVALAGPAVRVANPLDADKPFLRRSLMPGLLGALAHNAARRQGEIRLFEVGVVFSHPDQGAPRVVERAGAGGMGRAELPGEREMLAVVFALHDDDARTAVAAWHVVADAFALDGVRVVSPERGAMTSPGLHPTRSAHLVVAPRPDQGDAARDGSVVLGSLGEIDPGVASAFGLVGPSGTARRIGWLEVDLGALFDGSRVPRRVTVGGAVSRFPSSDVDLAFVVADRHGADEVADALRSAAGELLEAVRLFDVYRGPGIDEGTRSLAYRLRFCSLERTLTDAEVGELRARCIEAVQGQFGAVLR